MSSASLVSILPHYDKARAGEKGKSPGPAGESVLVVISAADAAPVRQVTPELRLSAPGASGIVWT
jgi:hypothetical protein